MVAAFCELMVEIVVVVSAIFLLSENMKICFIYSLKFYFCFPLFGNKFSLANCSALIFMKFR